MRVRYDAETDILLVLLRDDAPMDAVEERGVIVSHGSDGAPVSVEFQGASARRLVPGGHLNVTVDEAAAGTA